jgi:uncharacterized coiled-coil protein SlyX
VADIDLSQLPIEELVTLHERVQKSLDDRIAAEQADLEKRQAKLAKLMSKLGIKAAKPGKAAPVKAAKSAKLPKTSEIARPAEIAKPAESPKPAKMPRVTEKSVAPAASHEPVAVQ